MDLVATCPKGFWKEWMAEGDCAGDTSTQDTAYAWQTRHRLAEKIREGDRFYVVAHGKLRGYAVVCEVVSPHSDELIYIYRDGGAVAVTLPITIKGFQGLRRRWWSRSIEQPFPGWRTP